MTTTNASYGLSCPQRWEKKSERPTTSNKLYTVRRYLEHGRNPNTSSHYIHPNVGYSDCPSLPLLLFAFILSHLLLTCFVPVGYASVCLTNVLGQTVVLKKILDGSSMEEERIFAKLLKDVKHTNIVELIGVCESPVSIIMEYLASFRPFGREQTFTKLDELLSYMSLEDIFNKLNKIANFITRDILQDWDASSRPGWPRSRVPLGGQNNKSLDNKKTQFLTNDNDPIIPRKHMRYLGVHMSTDLTFNYHIYNVVKKGTNLAHWILHAFRTRATFPMKILLKTLLVPVLEYACLVPKLCWPYLPAQGDKSVSSLFRPSSSAGSRSFWSLT